MENINYNMKKICLLIIVSITDNDELINNIVTNTTIM